MSQVTPPRLGHIILESLGASKEFRDPIIGDLAQEYAGRVEESGFAVARLWYYREMLRTAPHMARNWWSTVNGAEIRQVLAVIAYTYVLMLLAEFLVLMLAFFAVSLLGLDDSTAGPGLLHPILVVLSTIFAGFTAASLYRKAPLIAAAAFGLTVSTLVFSLVYISPDGFTSMLLASALLAPLGALYGGLIRERSGNKFARWVTA